MAKAMGFEKAREAILGRIGSNGAADAPRLRYARVEAMAGAGKTALLESLARALAVGCGREGEGAPRRVAVVCASAQAAKDMAARVADAGTHEVEVATPFRVASRVLEVAGAARFGQGRAPAPRVLIGAARTALAHDVSLACPDVGVRDAAKAIAFYEAYRAALKPVPRDLGAAVLEAVSAGERHLAVMGGVLRGELSASACEALESDRGDSLRAAYDAVLVDDAQSMSAATLRMCELLARDMLVVAGDGAAALPLGDACPAPAAFAHFAEDHAECLDIGLSLEEGRPASMRKVVQALRAEAGAESSGDEPAFELPLRRGEARDDATVSVKWREPESEAVGVARVARRFMNQAGAEPGDVYIAVPSRAWAHVMASGVAQRAMDSAVLMDGEVVSADASGNAGAAAFALMALAFDRENAVAWRLWFAAGSETCRAREWAALVRMAEERGCGVVEMLDALGSADEGSDAFGDLPERYRLGLREVARVAQLRGLSLMNWAVREDAALAALFPDMRGDETVFALIPSMAEYEFDPAFADTTREVRIGSLRHAHGAKPRLLVVAGCVEGLFGAGAGEARALRQLRGLYLAAGAARERLVFSRSQKCEASAAQRYRMKPARFKAEGGRRMAMLKRAPLLGDLGDAIPGEVSGEQFLQE